MKNNIKNILIVIVLIVILIVIASFSILRKEKEKDLLKIYFFKAGKADAILISKNDKYMMIDTGESSLSDEILTYFRNNNINKLEYLIITHFDKDHVGSASEIIDNIDVKNIYQTNTIKESAYYKRYIESINKKSIKPIIPEGDQEVQFTDTKLVINGSNNLYEKNESNNSSLIVSLSDNNNKFLFMGDAQNARINDYLSTHKEKYDFLKVPYHGNKLKRNEELIDSIQPKYAVITSSKEEPESNETIQMLKKHNVKYYLTRNGAISVLSSDGKIRIKQ